MLSVSEATERLQAAARLLVGVESCSTLDAQGRVLAEDVHSDIDVPPADNSAMDGYALKHADWSGAAHSLSVSQRIPAGQSPARLKAGTAARIFTGAEVPQQADTVVMQEHCEESDGEVRVLKLPDRAANVRPRGQDIQAGQRILRAGQRLRAQDLGLVASIGVASLAVHSRLKVAVISNGDELVEPGAEASAGKIYNSNRYLLKGLFDQWGFETIDLGIAPDQPDQIKEMFGRAAEMADVLVTSGGVSVGEEDHIKNVVQQMGTLDLWKVAIKPGKPMAFGEAAGIPFIGLPGNPASVLVTAMILARPFLFASQGNAQAGFSPVSVNAGFSRKGTPRQEYLRARNINGVLELYPNQSSGVLLSASWGDGLVVQYPDQDIQSGEMADFVPYALLG